MDLKAVREAAGVSQRELARRTEISQARLSRLEASGAEPTTEEREIIAEALEGEGERALPTHEDAVLITLRLSKQDSAIIDTLIGGADRVMWIQELLGGAVTARRRYGKPCGLAVVATQHTPEGAVGVEREPEGDFQPNGAVPSDYGDD